jgi:hypothetical protein
LRTARLTVFAMLCGWLGILPMPGYTQAIGDQRPLAALATATPGAADPIPAEMTRRFETLYRPLQPSAKSWVDQEARRLARSGTVNAGAVRSSVQSRFPTLLATSTAQSGIEAMAFVVMMQATNGVDTDLASIMNQVKAITNAKQQLRDILNEVNQSLANSAQQGYPEVKCPNPPPGYVCPKSLQTQLANLSAATAQLPRPIHLSAPPRLTHAALSTLSNQLLQADRSLTDLTSELQGRIRHTQQTRSHLLKTLSDIMKKIDSTAEKITQNLK